MHIQRSAKASAARRVFEGIVVPMVKKCNAADDALALRPEGVPQIRRSRVSTLEKVDAITCELRLAATNLGGSECVFYSLQYTSGPCGKLCHCSLREKAHFCVGKTRNGTPIPAFCRLDLHLLTVLLSHRTSRMGH